MATHTAAPSDMALLLGLTAISQAVANKAVVVVKTGYSEPLMIWTASVAPPGSRKSAVFRLMMAPIYAYEGDALDKYRADMRKSHDETEIVKQALKKAKKEAADALRAGNGYEQVKGDVEELRRRLSELQVPEADRTTIADVTPERLGQLMQERFGRAAIVSAEGDIFSIMAGLYGDGSPHLEVFKKGWTGDEAISDERITRKGTCVARPALVMGVTIQPIVLTKLKHKEQFRGEGLLGRFLFAEPDARIGYRPTGGDLPALDEKAQQRYAEGLRTLLDAKPAEEEAEDWVAHKLPLSAQAIELRNIFDAEIERELRPGANLDGVEDWGGKIVGNSVRVAGLIHLARRVQDREDLWSSAVSGEAMEIAVGIGKALIPHALRVFDGMDELPETRSARYVLERIVAYDGEGLLTRRELHRRCQSRFPSVEGLDDPLELLERHNMIRQSGRNSGGGRPPSPLIELNPQVPRRHDTSDKSACQAAAAARPVAEEAWDEVHSVTATARHHEELDHE